MTTDAVSRPTASHQSEGTIVRYTFVERANHWIDALSYIYLLMTGLAFWSPYLYWLAAVVGGGPAARFWHPWLGLIFAASLVWSFTQWHRDMQIDPADRAWAKAIPDYIQNEDDKLPPVGRFNYGQKLFFWGIFYGVILLLLSGVFLWYTEALPWSLRFVRYTAILIHASVALITIGLFLIHVYMSAVLEEGSFGSMIHGYVTRAWAWTFHRTWYYEVTGKSHDVAAGRCLHVRNRLGHAGLRAAGDNDARTFPRQACGDGKPDTRCAAGDQRAPAFKLEVHAFSFSCGHPQPGSSGDCGLRPVAEL